MPPNNEDLFRNQRQLSVWFKFIKAFVNSTYPDDISTMSLIKGDPYSPKINIPLADNPGNQLNPYIKILEGESDRLQNKYDYSDPGGKDSMYSRASREQIDAAFCASDLGSCMGESSAEPIFKGLKSFLKQTKDTYNKWREISKTANAYRKELSENNTRYPSGYGVTPIHIVKNGETLNDISKRYGVSKQDIINKNSWLRQDNSIKQGDKITIPKMFDLDELTRIQNQQQTNPLQTKGVLNDSKYYSNNDVLVDFVIRNGVIYCGIERNSSIPNYNSLLYKQNFLDDVGYNASYYSDDYKSFFNKQSYLDDIYNNQSLYDFGSPVQGDIFNTYQQASSFGGTGDFRSFNALPLGTAYIEPPPFIMLDPQASEYFAKGYTQSQVDTYVSDCVNGTSSGTSPVAYEAYGSGGGSSSDGSFWDFFDFAGTDAGWSFLGPGGFGLYYTWFF